MKKSLIVGVFLSCFLALSFIGCGPKPEASGGEAIQKSQTMATVEQKVNYLAGQAKAFVNSKQYDQAVQVAQHILSNLDSNSAQARSILEQAKSELANQAKAKLDEVKKQFANFGK